jgi:hypothetical protein
MDIDYLIYFVVDGVQATTREKGRVETEVTGEFYVTNRFIFFIARMYASWIQFLNW